MPLAGGRSNHVCRPPAMDAARACMEQEPFYSNGVYKDINFQRWRFGRVTDRFK